MREFIQNRIIADNEDQAAVMIRKKHNEINGSLHIKRVDRGYNWYEYCIEIKE